MTIEEEREGMYVTGYVAGRMSADGGPWMSVEQVDGVRLEGHEAYRKLVGRLPFDPSVDPVAAMAAQETTVKIGGVSVTERTEYDPRWRNDPLEVSKRWAAVPPYRPSWFARLLSRIGTWSWV